MENTEVKVLWDFNVKTDHVIVHRRSHTGVLEKKEKNASERRRFQTLNSSDTVEIEMEVARVCVCIKRSLGSEKYAMANYNWNP